MIDGGRLISLFIRLLDLANHVAPGGHGSTDALIDLVASPQVHRNAFRLPTAEPGHHVNFPGGPVMGRRAAGAKGV